MVAAPKGRYGQYRRRGGIKKPPDSREPGGSSGDGGYSRACSLSDNAPQVGVALLNFFSVNLAK
jgi:hypothetical protein